MATFYLDQDVNRRIATALRRLGHTVSTAHDEGASTADDDEQLLIAIRRTAILLTHNFNDYKLLHSAWRRWTVFWNVDTTHPGILIIPQQRWSPTEAAERIVEHVESMDEDLKNQMFRWRPSTGWYRVD